TFIVTDECGNTNTCSFNITVIDNKAPNVVCQNITVELDNTGSATITASQLYSGATDNCDIASVTASQSIFDCSDVTVGGSSASELFISEYHEAASGNEKFIELYNPTSSSIDLSTYRLAQYNNGSSSPTSLALSGTINANSTFVIANSGSTLYPSANLSTSSSVMTFNGNDVMALQT